MLTYTLKPQNFMVWRRILQQKKLWIFCSNIDLEKIDEFGWWDLERISADAGSQFFSMEFKEEYQTCGVYLTLADPEHQ